MRALFFVAIVVLAGLLTANGTSGPAGQAEVRERRVLFIGNSLTTVNGLPELGSSLANAAGKPAVCEAVAFNNFSLQDHWQQGDARKAIARGGWSAVVLHECGRRRAGAMAD